MAWQTEADMENNYKEEQQRSFIMGKNYELVFDNVILKQLKKAGRNKHLKSILSNMLDKIEAGGPNAGELLDSKLHIYEAKNMHPPITMYYKHDIITSKIYIFEYEMKTGREKQKKTVEKVKNKASKP